MRKLENNWKELDKIILNILSAEYIFNSSKSKVSLNCGFENLNKGRCIVNIDKSIRGSKNQILIFSDKALMKLNIFYDSKNYEKVLSWLSSRTGRKNKLSVFLSKGLLVNSGGYLYIKKNTELEVKSIEWLIPLI
tara:strand:+ start:188 stop:592 length:405 start_codon:yes stop_codon:yes gene_type:complete